MEGPPGAEAVILLLQLLPSEAVERVLAFFNPADAWRVRATLTTDQGSHTPEAEAHALQTFFDLQNIADRPAIPPTAPAPAVAAGESSPADIAISDDPTEALRSLEPGLLARALVDEHPATAALVLNRLDSTVASEVLKRLPAARRSEIAVRICQAPGGNYVLAERLTRAVHEKASKLAAIPVEPSRDDRMRSLAAMLRRLSRPERAEVLSAIESTDPQAVERIRKDMFAFGDLLKVEDRPLQNLLTGIDLKTLATALKGASDDIAEKIFRNISSRTRQALTDEISLLAAVPKSATLHAQEKIVDLMRQHENEGKITFEA